ncbi:MAG: M48 family metalloprotease, partial [Verrucomicrobiota bacterium]
MSSPYIPEKPLTPPARLLLALTASVTLLVCFLFVIVSILLLLVVLALELVLVIGALRFGFAGVLFPIFHRHVGLLRLFLSMFGFRKNAKFHIVLQPQDAPGLFAILQNLCVRLKLAMPREVALEMGCNAWVRLKGSGRGAGKTVLGIGYDLLAGLNEKEIEGVFAHELVHAKLIQRGFRNLIWTGLTRFLGLANGLSAHAEAFRRVKKTFGTAEMFLYPADSLARLLSRLVATYSRQDEFDADRGAAELCGAGAIRSSLNKLDPLGEKVARLPWNERVAQLQLPQGFSQWLVKELTLDATTALEPAAAQISSKYSTHPLLRDRIAALDSFRNDSVSTNHPPAIGLLTKPDAAAQRLLAEIQRILAKEEEKDSKALRNWTKKTQRNANIHPLHLLGGGLVLGGVICIFAAFFTKEHLGIVILGAALIGLGIIICLRFGFKDRLALTVPDYSLLKQWKPEKLKDISAVQKQIEKELNDQISGVKKKRAKVLHLVKHAYDALATCDYLRVHVASRLAQNLDKNSAEPLIGLSIAAAALNMREQSAWALNALRKITGFKTNSSTWAAGWALLLLGDWNGAEGFLDQAVKQYPGDQTLLILLSIARSRRGKSQSAIETAKKACLPKPKNKEHAQYFIDLLIDNGQLLQARQFLKNFETETESDVDLMLSLVRLNLMQHNFEAAAHGTELVMRKSTDPYHQIRLGHAYELARKNEQAAEYFKRALEKAHFPEACLALARLQVHSKNKSEARRHLLAALNIKLEVGENGAPALSLFPQAIGQLVMLNEPVDNCRAWIANCGPIPPIPSFQKQSFLVFAPTRSEAEKYLQEIGRVELITAEE